MSSAGGGNNNLCTLIEDVEGGYKPSIGPLTGLECLALLFGICALGEIILSVIIVICWLGGFA